MLRSLSIAILLATLLGCQTQQVNSQQEKTQQVAAPTEDGKLPPAEAEAKPAVKVAAKPDVKAPLPPSACAAKFYARAQGDPVEAKIYAALAEPTTMDFDRVPLKEVVETLKKQHKIEIQLDRKALDEVGIETDVMIVRHLKGVSLASVLNLLLRDLDLTYIIKDEVLLITTPEVAENYLVTQMYDVRELISLTSNTDIYSVIDLIDGIIYPTTWDSVGGPGSMSPYDEILIVNQTHEVHAQVARLLTQLCRLMNGEIKPSTVSVPVSESSAGLLEDAPTVAKNVAAIDAALKTETSLDFDETPLQEALDTLSKAHAINIILDRKSLDEAGIETTLPVTRKITGLTLASALGLLLRDLDLTYIVKDEVLLITTPDVSENFLVTRLYPVGDLVVTGEKDLTAKLLEASDKPEPDYEALRIMLVDSVTPTTWDVVGGPGSISYFPPSKCLVVQQSQEVHEQIEEVLGLLRDSLKRRPAPPEAAASIPPDRVMTLVYSLGHREIHPALRVVGGLFQIPQEQAAEESEEKDTEQPKAVDAELPLNPSTVLAKQIKKHIAPESWQDKRFTIDPLAKQLVIRQTYAVHKQIARFLKNLGELSPRTDLQREPIREIAAPSRS